MILDKSALATSSYLKKASTIGRHTFLMFWAASHWSDAGPETKERMEYALRLHLRSMRQRGYSSSVTGPWLNCGGSVYFGSPEGKPLLLGRDPFNPVFPCSLYHFAGKHVVRGVHRHYGILTNLFHIVGISAALFGDGCPVLAMLRHCGHAFFHPSILHENGNARQPQRLFLH